MNHRVLFVDDEPRILSGLRRMLRVYRESWEMEFVDSGAAALQAMAAEPYDVVVSDVRMPGMDGIELLAKVAERFPDTIRVILSGHSDQVDTLRSTSVAHQYLAKPCDADALRATIERATALRAQVSNPALAAAVGGLRSLPPAPTLFQELTAELTSPDTSLQRVGDLVARDPGVAAKILQVVNSAFFALRRSVSDIHEAVTMLGTDTVRALVLRAHLFDTPGKGGASGAVRDELSQASIAVATLAREVAKSEGGARPRQSAAFLAGLLHDCGKLIFLGAADPATIGVLRGDDLAAEREIFGASHADVGAYLLAMWGLPDDVVAAVAHHHRPAIAAADPEFSTVEAVHVAWALNAGVEPDDAYLSASGRADRVPVWKVLADEHGQKRVDA